ncbi:hypothetical protein [Sphingobacterium sp.]|uniref:hypothetical protein n=1 Tax=Sphingobacterium sp. TaxID=341027 RepID=UPI00289C2583|nr:hypothetical protein [Sphingobacterium sp.]
MPIRTADLPELNRADYDSLVEIFGELSDNFLIDRFLLANSFLENDAADIIDRQYSKTPKKRKKYLSKHVGQYIAASTLLHNMDGWKYYGAAISSLLKGDINIAKHLIYYSELRACMSLLASNGIGVFNNRHLLVNNKKKVSGINKKITGSNTNKVGTHEFSWEAFNYLRREDSFLNRIFDNFHVDGIKLSEWLDKFGINASHLSSITSNLLNLLSFDLSQFAKDRSARNEASYRPNNIFENKTFNLNDILSEIEDIWILSQPMGSQGEITIDLIILTEILQSSFKNTHVFGKSHKSANKQYRHKLEIMLNSFGLAEARKTQLLNIFNSSNNNIFRYITNQDIKSDKFIVGMLYRAFIFLRLSNNYVRNILKKNNHIDKESLYFWWNNLGISTGLWQEGYEPENFEDLWEDIYTAIEESKLDSVSPNFSTNELWTKFSNFAFLFSTYNRVGLWGLGI